MDIKKIFDLIDKAETSSFDKIEIRLQELSINLERRCVCGAAADAAGEPADNPCLTPAPAEADADIIPAPISGVFYVAKEPGAEPFVREGGRVSTGEPLCIIEAMKMMNEICAPRSGIIERVQAADGQAVKAGDALFKYAKEK